MKRWDGEHYVQLRAFQNELYCIEIDFKIYINPEEYNHCGQICIISSAAGIRIIESDSNVTIHFYPQFCKNSIASYTLENVTLLVFNHWFLTSVSSIPGSPSCNNAFTVFFEFSTAF